MHLELYPFFISPFCFVMSNMCYKETRGYGARTDEMRHDLIVVASLYMKVSKAPYTQALEGQNDKDRLFVDSPFSSRRKILHMILFDARFPGASGLVEKTTSETLGTSQSFYEFGRRLGCPGGLFHCRLQTMDWAQDACRRQTLVLCFPKMGSMGWIDDLFDET